MLRCPSCGEWLGVATLDNALSLISSGPSEHKPMINMVELRVIHSETVGATRVNIAQRQIPLYWWLGPSRSRINDVRGLIEGIYRPQGRERTILT